MRADKLDKLPKSENGIDTTKPNGFSLNNVSIYMWPIALLILDKCIGVRSGSFKFNLEIKYDIYRNKKYTQKVC